MLRRMRGVDILKLEFDDESIEAFIAMVEDLKVVSATWVCSAMTRQAHSLFLPERFF